MSSAVAFDYLPVNEDSLEVVALAFGATFIFFLVVVALALFVAFAFFDFDALDAATSVGQVPTVLPLKDAAFSLKTTPLLQAQPKTLISTPRFPGYLHLADLAGLCSKSVI
jgi:hypothetical protein